MSNTSFELSPLYRHTSSQFAFFPAELPLVITCHLDRLILRHTETLAIQQTWQLPIGPPPAKAAPAPPSQRQSVQATSSAARPEPQTSAGNPKLPPPESLLTNLEVSSEAPHRILAFSARAGTGWVLDKDLDQPVAKIDVGGEGAVAMAWSAVGDTVMVWSGSHLRLSLYRLNQPSPALHINNPKLNYPHGFSFRPDGQLLAIAERHNGRDHIGVYDTGTWKLLRHFALPTPTSDIADLAWSPCGRYIAVWEAVTEYLLHVYTPDGRLLSTFAPYANISPATTTDPAAKGPSSKSAANSDAAKKTGSLSMTEQARDERSVDGWVGLGIRTVAWHPTGDWLAVGGWDGKIRVLTRLSWAPVAELTHPTRTTAPAAAWREPSEWIERTRGRGIVNFEPLPLPHQALPVRPDLARTNPRMGVADLAWSPSGRYLASYSQSFPSQLFVFSFLSGSGASFRPRLQTTIHLNSAVRSLSWQPERMGEEDTLVIVSGTKSFALWREGTGVEDTEAKVEGVGIPAHAAFGPHALKFAPGGEAVFLQDREMFALAYPVKEGEDADGGEGGRTWIGDDEP